MKETIERAPAKVNLFLEVTARRPDGYHELETLFAKLDFGDSIEISSGPGFSGIRLEIENESGCFLDCGDDNLVVRAARAYLNEYGIRASVKMKLKKRIPIGAGLGGGSSDAAAVIRGLHEIYGGGTSPCEARLVKMGAKLGADVPVFLYKEAFCVGRGIGDILEPLNVKSAMPHIVLVYPGEGVSTAFAYGKLELGKPPEVLTNRANLNKLINSLGEGESFPGWKILLYNRLEKAVLPFKEVVAKVKSELCELGAPAAMMSGSGSTVFALTDDACQAAEIAKRASGEGRRVVKTAFLRGGSNGDYRDPNSSDERGQAEGVCKRDI
ncbi:MAG: 4-(cytidine 5'-diphospho)-2-C-methyl-D-erythritol kinase [Elusimicrobiaceae bacterium]